MKILLSKRAENKILKLLEKEPTGSFLRLEILGGGCAGFQYIFRIDSHKNHDDSLFGDLGVLAIDKESSQFLEGAEIDFSEDLMGSSFVVKNPKASSSCGCGSSFSPG